MEDKRYWTFLRIIMVAFQRMLYCGYRERAGKTDWYRDAIMYSKHLDEINFLKQPKTCRIKSITYVTVFLQCG